jgi:ADP-ribosyl-[dinitrogen reductase] hydrolase
MRVNPHGIHAAGFSRIQAADWARADATLTHPDRVCPQAIELDTMAIAEAVATGPAPDAL